MFQLIFYEIKSQNRFTLRLFGGLARFFMTRFQIGNRFLKSNFWDMITCFFCGVSIKSTYCFGDGAVSFFANNIATHY